MFLVFFIVLIDGLTELLEAFASLICLVFLKLENVVLEIFFFIEEGQLVDLNEYVFCYNKKQLLSYLTRQLVFFNLH